MSKDRLRDLADALENAERRRCDSQRLSGVGFWELNHKNETLYWSEEIFAIYELEANTLETDYEKFVSLIHEDDRDWVTSAYQASVESGVEYNIRYRIKAGESTKWIEARGITYYDSDRNPERTIGTAQDISEITNAQHALEHLALHDALTGLPNRKLFSNRMDEALQTAQRDECRLGVLFIDLDNFKLINDHQGHDIGDEVLVGVAEALARHARDGDSFARLGGDEFVGLISETAGSSIGEAVERVKESIDRTYDTSRGSFTVTASIGVAIYPLDSEEPDELVRHADHAMYEAKESGKSRIRYFDAKQHWTNRSRNQLLLDIKEALENDRFVLHFQPRVCLIDGSLAGAEALLRWFRPEGPVPPSDVIAAISGTPLEWALDAWVVEAALLEFGRFFEGGLLGPYSVNVNPGTIENKALPALLQQLIGASDVSGSDLEIELLEVSSIRNFALTTQILQKCKKLGISFSLDDFGTGYSSLTYFHSLPVDKLKIDRSFIQRLLSDQESLPLIKSILAIAKANDRPVIAEGVESYAIARELRRLGCQYGQGFGLSRPMGADEYVAWARRWDPKAFIAQMEEPDRSPGNSCG